MYVRTITQPLNQPINFTKTASGFNGRFSIPKKIRLSLSGDYIEVPGGSDSVPYTDDEGNNYEIPLDDLIEYDGDDGEIEYRFKKKNGYKVLLLPMKIMRQNYGRKRS